VLYRRNAPRELCSKSTGTAAWFTSRSLLTVLHLLLARGVTQEVYGRRRLGREQVGLPPFKTEHSESSYHTDEFDPCLYGREGGPCDGGVLSGLYTINYTAQYYCVSDTYIVYMAQVLNEKLCLFEINCAILNNLYVYLAQ